MAKIYDIRPFCELQARCKIGRDVIRSFGRKRRNVRSVAGGRGQVQETTKEAALADAAAVSRSLPLDNANSEEEMSISQEILVLDLGDETADHYKSDPQLVPEEEPSYSTSKYCFTMQSSVIMH